MITLSTTPNLFLFHTGRRKPVPAGARLNMAGLYAMTAPLDPTNDAQSHNIRIRGRRSDATKLRDWAELKRIPVGGIPVDS